MNKNKVKQSIKCGRKLKTKLLGLKKIRNMVVFYPAVASHPAWRSGSSRQPREAPAGP